MLNDTFIARVRNFGICTISVSAWFLSFYTAVNAAPPTNLPGCAFLGKAANEVLTTAEAAALENSILNGCDPPADRVPLLGNYRGGVRKGVAGVANYVEKASSSCPPTITKDKTCGMLPIYPFCTGQPGGKSSGGALSVCDFGFGAPTGGVTDVPPTDPSFDSAFMQCLQKLLGAMSGGGGGLGGIVSVGGSFTGTCAGGSVSVCGVSAAGSICVDDDDGDGKNDVTLHGPLTITLAPDVINWVWLTTGGTVTLPDGSTVTVPPGGKVTMGPGGVSINGGAPVPVPQGGKVTVTFQDKAKIHDDVVAGGSLR